MIYFIWYLLIAAFCLSCFMLEKAVYGGLDSFKDVLWDILRALTWPVWFSVIIIHVIWSLLG